MQALEKIEHTNYWVIFVLLGLLVIVFFLKGLNGNKLKGYVTALVTRDFVEVESENKVIFFSFFHALIFVFSMAVLSLLGIYFSEFFTQKGEGTFSAYSTIFLFIALFFLIKWFLEYLLVQLFLIKNEVRFYLVTRSLYLYSISFVLYIGVIILEYTSLKQGLIIYIGGGLFLLRFIILIVNNKKLIFNKLFYFILYLCAFEIAPLFILFKLIF